MKHLNICVVCGKKFLAKSKRKLCCSKECKKEYQRQYDADRYKKKEPKVYNKTCPICGTLFTTYRHNKKYCSPECVKEAIDQHRRNNYDPAKEAIRYKKRREKYGDRINQQARERYANGYSEVVKSRREERKDVIKKQRKASYEKNKERIHEKNRQKYWDNREECLANNKKYRDEHKDELNKRRREKRQQNLQQIREQEAHRLKTDKVFKLKKWCREQVHRCLHSKKTKATFDILDYSPEDLKNHIEALWEPDMNWDNYGTCWNIDHIKPLSAFSFFKGDGTIDYEVVKEANSLMNLRPMYASDNFSKGGKWTLEDEIEYKKRLDK